MKEIETEQLYDFSYSACYPDDACGEDQILGRGATKEEAIQDLKEQYQEEEHIKKCKAIAGSLLDATQESLFASLMVLPTHLLQDIIVCSNEILRLRKEKPNDLTIQGIQG